MVVVFRHDRDLHRRHVHMGHDDADADVEMVMVHRGRTCPCCGGWCWWCWNSTTNNSLERYSNAPCDGSIQRSVFQCAVSQASYRLPHSCDMLCVCGGIKIGGFDRVDVYNPNSTVLENMILPRCLKMSTDCENTSHRLMRHSTTNHNTKGIHIFLL